MLTPRDLSALAFHARVLAEAENPDNPLMERANFLAITVSGLEEFQRVRLPRLKGEVKDAALLQLEQLYAGLRAGCDALVAELAQCGVTLADEPPLGAALEQLTEIPAEVLPGSTLLLAATDKQGGLRFFSLEDRPRLLPLGGDSYAPVETLLRGLLLEGKRTEATCLLRILRDEHAVAAEDAPDVTQAVQECMVQRRQGKIMRLETNAGKAMAKKLCTLLGVKKNRLHRQDGLFHPGGIMRALASLPGYEGMHYPPFEPARPRWMEGDIFAAIREKDRVLIHPYDSFEPVIRLLESAAADASVQGVYATLYRVKQDSALVRALCHAARMGRQVTVLVETRARFDEERNLALSQQLKDAGCRVIAGPNGYKVHSKVLLVTRKETGGLVRYVHLGTGNYHEGTARFYTDAGLFTADATLGKDAEKFFACLMGQETALRMEALFASPWEMRQELTRLIRREMTCAMNGRPSGIVAKMNALTDPELIALLCDASRAGVPIDLTVRGACCLKPGVPGMTDNIRVRSLVGRFLEHARVFYFIAGGKGEVYISSADWMTRSLERRIELLTPVRDEGAQAALLRFLRAQQQDSAKAWYLRMDDYTAARCCASAWIDTQQEMLSARA